MIQTTGLGVPPSSMIVESIPEHIVEESEQNSMIERERGEKDHRDTVIKQFKRIDQSCLTKIGLGAKQDFDEDAVKSAY